MSYDVYLKKEPTDEASSLPVPLHKEGGVICTCGDTAAEMVITYNYGEVYHLFGFSIDDLHKKQALDVILRLRGMVRLLGTKKYERDYWAPTPGNAGHALSILLQWAELHPDGYFWVS